MDELDDALGAYHGAIRLAPVDLCVASEIELKRQEDVRTALIRAAFADVAAYRRLTAFVAFFADDLEDPLCCVALLTRQALALGEQLSIRALNGSASATVAAQPLCTSQVRLT